MLEDVLWKKLELPNLHTCKKMHEGNTYLESQRALTKHNKGVSTNSNRT